MQELTPRQTSVLKFIENFVRKFQQPPTEREIAGHFRIHQSAVRKHLTALENKGRLTLRRDGRSRGIRLNDIAPAARVPIVGMIEGEGSLLDAENLEGAMMLDASFVGSEETFLMRLEGDAMNEAGMIEGDLLLVRRAESVRNGEIVVARFGGELVVRRFFEIAGRIVLEPASRNHRPLTVEKEQFQLEGRVVALIRDMNDASMRRRPARRPSAAAATEAPGDAESTGGAESAGGVVTTMVDPLAIESTAADRTLPLAGEEMAAIGE